MLDIGDILPDLPLTLARGSAANLADFRGRWLVLYFYPKDSTPGCTTEGRDFSNLLTKFRRLDADVIGVSRDSVKSHLNFIGKQDLGLDLASDPDETLCNAFGVIRLKNMYGRQVLGIERSTFLVDPDGRIVQAWRGVRVPGHAEAVLDALKQARGKK